MDTISRFGVTIQENDKQKEIEEELIAEGEMEIDFKVEAVIFRKPETGFSIIKAKILSSESRNLPKTKEYIVLGSISSLEKEDKLRAEGQWLKDKRYGLQFKANFLTIISPVNEEDIAKFLARYATGVGAKTAQRIVSKLGIDTLQKIRDDWSCLLGIPRVAKKKAQLIQKDILKTKSFDKLSMFVLQCGGSLNLAIRIFNVFSDSSIIQIQENPYALLKVPTVGFTTAEKFAERLGFPYDSKSRITAGVLYYMDKQMEINGHMYLSKDELIKSSQKFLTTTSVYSKPVPENLISNSIDELIYEKKLNTYTNQKGTVCIYGKSGNFIEDAIVKRLEELISAHSNFISNEASILEFIKNYEKSYDFKFADNQKRAIVMALTNNLSILTGGPGTGKTQTINAIIKAINHFRNDATIKLAAPTGKAAMRMTELSGMPSQTIHKLAKIQEHDAESCEIIEADVIIVDETSMVDAFLFKKLLSVITDGTKLLIVGDYDQLPSVGPGLILRDLITSGCVPVTRLTEIFRQSENSQITLNSHKIIKGLGPNSPGGVTFDHSKKDSYFIQRKNEESIRMGILQSVERLLKTGHSIQEIQILSPMKKGVIGTIELNRAIQETFNPQSKSKRQTILLSDMILREGDRVIHIRNNYELEVFNGEVGIISRILNDENGALIDLVVDYDGREVYYDRESVEELILAYAITIHKSQGSEFPIVILPIFESQKNMLNRNIIYTAWTRAKMKVITIGSLSALNYASKKTDNTIRNSNIKEKLLLRLQKPD